MKRFWFLLLLTCLLLTAGLLVGCSEEEEVYYPTYSIEYNCNGGTLSGGGTDTYTTETVFTFPIPTRAGYTFLGWCERADLSDTPITDTTNKNSNLTLYAKWRQNTVAVNFYVNGQKVPALAQEIPFGGNATLPSLSDVAEYIPEGKVFTGWQGNYTGLTSNTDIIAILQTATVTVEFYVGGTLVDTQEVVYGGDAILPSLSAIEAVIPEGKVFTGWQGNYTDLTENTVLTAILVDDTEEPPTPGDDPEPPAPPVTHTIVLHTNGGTLSFPPTKYTEGVTLYLPTPTRTGSTFVGWYASQDFDGDPIENTEGCTTDLELFAKWETPTFRVTFQFKNPVTGKEEQIGEVQIIPYGGNAVLPDPNSFIPKGYSFLGWNRSHENITSDRVIAAMIVVNQDGETWSPPIN